MKAFALAAGLFLASSGLASATTWDLGADFDLNKNPNGQWTYGYSSTIGGAITPFTYVRNLTAQPADVGAFVYWAGNTFVSSPYGDTIPFVGVMLGPLAREVTTKGGANLTTPAIKQRAGKVVMHSYLGKQAVVRWTAQTAGTYHINATFSNADYQAGATVNVSVMKSGAALYQSTMSGKTGLKHFATPDSGVALVAGDKVDFVVDANGNYGYDSTALDVIIKNVDVAQ